MTRMKRWASKICLSPEVRISSARQTRYASARACGTGSCNLDSKISMSWVLLSAMRMFSKTDPAFQVFAHSLCREPLTRYLFSYTQVSLAYLFAVSIIVILDRLRDFFTQQRRSIPYGHATPQPSRLEITTLLDSSPYTTRRPELCL